MMSRSKAKFYLEAKQGHVIAKPNQLILSLLMGMGIFFLIMPLAQTPGPDLAYKLNALF